MFVIKTCNLVTFCGFVICRLGMCLMCLCCVCRCKFCAFACSCSSACVCTHACRMLIYDLLMRLLLCACDFGRTRAYHHNCNRMAMFIRIMLVFALANGVPMKCNKGHARRECATCKTYKREVPFEEKKCEEGQVCTAYSYVDDSDCLSQTGPLVVYYGKSFIIYHDVFQPKINLPCCLSPHENE